MKKAFRIMLSTMLACLLLVGMMSTALAVDGGAVIIIDPSNNSFPTNDPTYDPNDCLNEQPAGPQYYPDYDENPVQEVVEEPAAQEPVPASPKTGDNGMAVVVLMGAAACVTLVAGRKALRA